MRLAAPRLLGRYDDWQMHRRLVRPPGDLPWQLLQRCPAQRLDAGGAQIGHQLFVFGGYESIDRVLSVVEILDLNTGTWCDRFPMPTTMAQSHLAIASDGARYVYAAGGQVGPQCRPATRACFALDTTARRWSELPPLPAARYAATAQLWAGRLHVVGGSREDRHTPAHEHWSIAVEAGRATESTWREDVPIPRGGPHRASAILCGKLHVFGGQEGDYVPIPGDAGFVCTGDLIDEWHHGEVHVLAPGAAAWTRAADLPLAASHTEFSGVQRGNRFAILGGEHVKNRKVRATALTAAIQCYDAERDTWEQVGTLPYRVKTNLAALHDGWLYSTLGLRDRGPDDPYTGPIVAHTWRTHVPRNWLG